MINVEIMTTVREINMMLIILIFLCTYKGKYYLGLIETIKRHPIQGAPVSRYEDMHMHIGYTKLCNYEHGNMLNAILKGVLS